MPELRPIKVFLCHATEDKPKVRALYRRLGADGAEVWLDEVSLLPGQDWRVEIPSAVRAADAVIVCLSSHAADKEGYIQKEIRFALDAADEKPDGTIYIIPAKLEDCRVPSRLAQWQWVNLFDADERGYDRLLASLRIRAGKVGASLTPHAETEAPKPEIKTPAPVARKIETPLPAKIYANEGLAQVLFFEADEACEVSYADKKDKYQKQQSIVLPKL